MPRFGGIEEHSMGLSHLATKDAWGVTEIAGYYMGLSRN